MAEQTNEQKAKEELLSKAPVQDNKQGSSGDKSEFERLKAQNDEMERELVRAREMRAEAQKLEAEKMLAGTAGGRIEPQPVKPSAKDYANSIMKGVIPKQDE